MRQWRGCWGVPDDGMWSEELCEFSKPRNVVVLPVLAVDERSDVPHKIWHGQMADGMGADYQVSWATGRW